MGLDKLDDDNIRNDKWAMPGRTALRTEIPGRTPKTRFSPDDVVKRLSHLRSISSHSNEGKLRFPRGERVGGLASHTLERVLGIGHRDHRPPHRSRAPPVVWGRCRTIRSESPLGVHLSYLDDPTTAVLTWYTASASTSRAEWGRSLGPPYSFHTTGTDYGSPGG